MGLLVSKVTAIAPFVGYVQNEEQTEKKRLRNVLKKGDLYFNSGDLMRIDSDNFIYFQDRVGDTFRLAFFYIGLNLFENSETYISIFHCNSCDPLTFTGGKVRM